MAKGRPKTKTITRFVKSRTRRVSRNGAKSLAKKAAKGVLGGLAVSVPLTLLARYSQQPMLMEAGQRGGAVAASALGGTPGQVGYQIADAMFDRFVVFNGNPVSGTPGQVYL